VDGETLSELNRRNVIELLGEDSRKYHSCLISTYSIDFGFFEQRLVPALHRLQIGNIHVLVDSHELEDAQFHLTSSTRLSNAGYSVQPIFSGNGVFHPKVMLLLGEKNGLLLVGSGNLTGPGFQTNEEVWSAFQVDARKELAAHASLLLDALEWLEQWKPSEAISVIRKWNWMRQFTPWLELLEEMPRQKRVALEDGRQVQFMGQDEYASTLDAMVEAIASRSIERMTCVSPFYDYDASGLKSLSERLSVKNVDVLLDVNRVPFDHFEGPQFFQWNSRWIVDEKSANRRLHAKLYHFLLNDGAEALYVGSSNATMAGLGVRIAGARNVEAGIWMERRRPAQIWLDELGIRTGGPALSPWVVPKDENMPAPEFVRRSNRRVQIEYAEHDGEHLMVALSPKSREVSEGVHFVIRDSEGLELIRVDVKWLDSNVGKATFKVLTFPSGFITVENELEIISNAVPVHAKGDVDRANPDPKRRRLEHLLREFALMGWGLEQVFQYEDGFRTEGLEKESENSIASNLKRKVEEAANSYTVLSTEELNRLASVQADIEQRKLQSSSSRLADFLNACLRGMDDSEGKEIAESEEQRLIQEAEEDGRGEAIQSVHEQMLFKESDVRAVQRYSKLCQDRYDAALSGFYQAPITNGPFEKARNQKPFEDGYKELSMMAMVSSSHVLLLRDEVSSVQQFQRQRIAKEFLENQVGSFCLMARGGFINHSPVSEYFENKVFDRVEDVIMNWVFIWMKLKWKRSERREASRIAVNLRMILNQLRAQRGCMEWGVVKGQLLEIQGWHLEMSQNLELFEAYAGYNFDSWWRAYEVNHRTMMNSFELTEGQWVVHRNLGVSEVRAVTRKESSNPKVHLVHFGRTQIVTYDFAKQCVAYPMPAI
jgi:hypothetical protein